MENRIMAGRTVIVTVPQVIFVAEWYIARILGFYNHGLLKISSNRTRKSKNYCSQYKE
jgi:hypothetical protein